MKGGNIMCKPSYPYSNTEMTHAISECIHSELHRTILHAILIDGWTYEHTAEIVDRTPRQIAYIVGKHAPRLEEWLCRKTS